MIKDLIAKPLVKELNRTIKQRIESLDSKPNLVVISLGKDPASEFYIRNIEKKGEKAGIEVEVMYLSEEIPQAELIELIEALNRDISVSGIMLQKPLPEQIDDSVIAETISPLKDVDGFNPVNLGKLMLDEDCLIPCTPAAVMEAISFYDIDLKGKHTVLCGRSHIVGKPLLNLLIRKQEPGNATVTLCHSRTNDLTSYTRQADILITALGLPRFIKADMVKEGVIILDIGTNEIQEADKTFYVGDVDYEDCYENAAAITPVPGGIGSITTAMLLLNVLKAAANKK